MSILSHVARNRAGYPERAQQKGKVDKPLRVCELAKCALRQSARQNCRKCEARNGERRSRSRSPRRLSKHRQRYSSLSISDTMVLQLIAELPTRSMTTQISN